MNTRAVRQITRDIREEFDGIRDDVRSHLAPTVGVDHARQLLSEHVPTILVGQGELLLDTLLNYLMEDAAKALADVPTEVKNEFYALGLRNRMRETFSLDPETLQFSFDPRVVAGGIAAAGTFAAGGLVVGLVLGGFVPRLVGALVTLVASAFAFRTAHSATTASARRQLEADVFNYLARSEEQVSLWLRGVEKSFIEAFDEFCRERGIVEETTG